MPNKLKRHALQFLTRRDHSKQELMTKLQKKGHSTEDIHPILDELSVMGYLNENRFVESYIRYRRQKGYGPERIALELANRGIADTMIAEQINFTDNAWLEEAHLARIKRFKDQLVKDFKAKAKQMRFLKYRGFTQEQIES